MTFSFDLISDLHIETWPNFDWSDQATSPYCIVAGDISRDHQIVKDTLEHLSNCYLAVFYIDGNDEHRYQLNDLDNSYQDLIETIGQIDNVVYLRENIVIVRGVAIIASNGWWTFDLDENLDPEQCREWWANRYDAHVNDSEQLYCAGVNDTAYMINAVKKLQTHPDVHSIVMITHTVPTAELINHDINLADTWRFNCLGNDHMQMAIREDTENKIKTWCFGHYHQPVDRILQGIRYVNNCRGRGDTDWSQSVYYPKKITIEL